MKKFLALLLALTMVLSLAACGGNGEAETTAAPAETTAPVETTEAPAVVDASFSVDYATNSVKAGAVTTALGEVGGGDVGHDVFAGIEGKDYTDPETYTYNTYITATSNMKWAPHTWETSDDSIILTYISSSFYEFVLNSTGDGWSIVPEMASELPVDVTADYVGQYGIEEGETGKAWKFSLNEAACWEDGTPINADSHIYGFKELLDPIMKNRRADSLYAGDSAIYNAKNYFYQGQTAYSLNGTALADLVAGDDGVYADADGNKMYISLNDTTAPYTSGYSLVQLAEMGYVQTEVIDGLTALADEKGYIPFTDESKALLFSFTNSDNWGNEPEETLSSYLFYPVTYAEMSFDEVGIVKTGDYELVFITEQPIESPNYYVPYQLGGTYLVHEELWESCKSYFDSNGNTVTADSEDIANITTTYGTSVETTMSYGPYKLTYFELDKKFVLERNENWYGYSDGKHVGQYQTDVIDYAVIPQQATQLLSFLNGELDGVSLTSADMATYGTSDYIRYTPQSYTTKLSFNTNLDSLATRGTQILANPLFRQAFALAIDRNTFATSYTSAGSAGYGLLNYMYIYDPFSGATYRDTDGAKDALVQLYGLTYGDDGEYGDLDEAYDAITGYDVAKAQELMAQAYDECVAAGYYDGSSEIKIQMSVYQSDDLYVQMFNFLNDALKTACTGTGFEGKVELEMVVDADYYETMYSGNTDIIFTTWGGAASSPYTMLYQCYCDAADGSGNQMEYGFDTTKVNVTINVDGVNCTDTLQNWALWANGDTDVQIKSEDGSMTLAGFNEYDADTRANMFSKLEYAYLSFYTTTPMYYRNVASLKGQQVNWPSDKYIDATVGFGGLAFYTYNYTDAEWDAYVAEGTLAY